MPDLHRHVTVGETKKQKIKLEVEEKHKADNQKDRNAQLCESSDGVSVSSHADEMAQTSKPRVHKEKLTHEPLLLSPITLMHLLSQIKIKTPLCEEALRPSCLHLTVSLMKKMRFISLYNANE